jgi:hypothetical protein
MTVTESNLMSTGLTERATRRDRAQENDCPELRLLGEVRTSHHSESQGHGFLLDGALDEDRAGVVANVLQFPPWPGRRRCYSALGPRRIGAPPSCRHQAGTGTRRRALLEGCGRTLQGCFRLAKLQGQAWMDWCRRWIDVGADQD